MRWQPVAAGLPSLAGPSEGSALLLVSRADRSAPLLRELALGAPPARAVRLRERPPPHGDGMLKDRPSSAVSMAFEGSLPPRSARFGVQTPRRDAARCLDLRATAPATAQSRPRQRALQGMRRPPNRPFAVVLGHRLNAWVSHLSFPREPGHRDTNCGGEPPSGAVAKCNARTPFSRRESRRCRCVGCQRRHVCVVWSRDFDGCNVDALPPREGAETDRDGPLRVGRDAPRRLPFEATGLALALLLETFGSHW